MKTTAALLVLCLAFTASYGYFPNGSIMGQVTDPVTKKPVGDAAVVFDCQGTQKVFYANENGYYYASNIPSCVYTVTVTFIGKKHSYPDVKLLDDQQMTFDLELVVSDIVLSDSLTVYGERQKGDKPLLDPINPTADIMLHSDIKVLPITNIGDLTEFQAGVTTINGNYYVHGARAGSLVYYIDGSRVLGTPEIPLSGVDSYQTYTGFLPAKYGDTNGGAIVIETRSYFGER